MVDFVEETSLEIYSKRKYAGTHSIKVAGLVFSPSSGSLLLLG